MWYKLLQLTEIRGLLKLGREFQNHPKGAYYGHSQLHLCAWQAGTGAAPASTATQVYCIFFTVFFLQEQAKSLMSMVSESLSCQCYFLLTKPSYISERSLTGDDSRQSDGSLR